MIFPIGNSIRCKDVVGYERLYKITDDGRVFSCRSNKFLKPMPEVHGYLTVWIYKKNYKPKNVKIHRLVAEAFIPNPNNYP